MMPDDDINALIHWLRTHLCWHSWQDCLWKGETHEVCVKCFTVREKR